MQELDAFMELLVMLVKDVRVGILFTLLILAAVIDVRTYRIPNWLTLSGMAIGILLGAIGGLSSPHGLLWVMGGMLAGLLTMLPLYVFRAMGAGDVKLMMMAGAYLGMQDTLYAVVAVFIAGGIAAIAFGLFHRALGRMFANIKSTAITMAWSAIGGTRPDASIAALKSVGKLPFGVSIAIGTIGFLLARQFGFA